MVHRDHPRREWRNRTQRRSRGRRHAGAIAATHQGARGHAAGRSAQRPCRQSCDRTHLDGSCGGWRERAYRCDCGRRASAPGARSRRRGDRHRGGRFGDRLSRRSRGRQRPAARRSIRRFRRRSVDPLRRLRPRDPRRGHHRRQRLRLRREAHGHRSRGQIGCAEGARRHRRWPDQRRHRRDRVRHREPRCVEHPRHQPVHRVARVRIVPDRSPHGGRAGTRCRLVSSSWPPPATTA